MAFKIEILTIGDEILSGAVTDTNSAWLGDRLWGMGYDLHWHTTIGDDPEKITRSLQEAAGRSQAVIVTGGLGPTLDDITLEVAAKAFGLPMVLNEVALQAIKNRFSRIGREMTPNNEKQALLPEGSKMIANKVGTAPGCHLVFQGTHFFFFPGVPREMQQQFDDYLLPALALLDTEKRAFAFRLLRCFGAPEATIAQKLEGIDLSGENQRQGRVEGEAPTALPVEGATRAPIIDLAYRVSFPEILIKVSAWGRDLKVLDGRVVEVVGEIQGRLGDLVYGRGEETLPGVVGRLLEGRKETLSVAESCTGGRLASLITDIPGSSRWFERGVVTYSNESKTELVGVPASLIKKFGAVSHEVAMAMARGVRKVANTTYGIGITGIAGPEGGTHEKPVGTVHIALDSADGTTDRELHFATNRDWFKRVVSFAALDLLRKKIRKP